MTRILAGAVLAAATGCGISTVPPQADREPARTDEVVVGQKTIWQDPDQGWVRLVAAEAGGGGYDHPIRLDSQWLRQVLYDIKLRIGNDDDDRRTVRLLQVKELDQLVPTLVLGLAEAGPDQAVAFAIAARHGGFTFFDPLRLTTARLFVADGKLNILFGPAEKPLREDEARASIANARLGSRERVLNKDDEIWSRGWGSSMEREDWVVLPVKTGDAPVPELPASGSAPSASSQDDASPSADSGAAPGSSPAPRRGVHERLELLKELHADGLITEEEYRAERRRVLEDL